MKTEPIQKLRCVEKRYFGVSKCDTSALRTAVWRELRWPRLAAGASVLLVDRRVVASGWHPFDFQIKTLREVRLRASRSYGQVLRSADIKAEGCDGTVDFRGESFERPMFSGVRGVNVARCHS
ncbi:MAG: hypothetical protein ACLQQB_09935, partial [Solirubrobacteraceae bacterium]